ncbi:hypothetical protein BP354E_5772 [Burkholderia pseudomallei 354e]|nr:hypothetical protein BP354E_5772 [Burkholderia pseudomallei 354e]EIF73344.1 hypothetical protein BP354A_5741 [Burkholderia pseudomallei 354a]
MVFTKKIKKYPTKYPENQTLLSCKVLTEFNNVPSALCSAKLSYPAWIRGIYIVKAPI